MSTHELVDHQWPENFRDDLARKIRMQRVRVVGPDGLVDLEEAARIREMNSMQGECKVRIWGAKEVAFLQQYWEWWLAWVRREDT